MKGLKVKFLLDTYKRHIYLSNISIIKRFNLVLKRTRNRCLKKGIFQQRMAVPTRLFFELSIKIFPDMFFWQWTEPINLKRIVKNCDMLRANDDYSHCGGGVLTYTTVSTRKYPVDTLRIYITVLSVIHYVNTQIYIYGKRLPKCPTKSQLLG